MDVSGLSLGPLRAFGDLLGSEDDDGEKSLLLCDGEDKYGRQDSPTGGHDDGLEELVRFQHFFSDAALAYPPQSDYQQTLPPLSNPTTAADGIGPMEQSSSSSSKLTSESFSTIKRRNRLATPRSPASPRAM